MQFVPPPLAPNLEAALRDLQSGQRGSRAAAAESLGHVGEGDRERALPVLRAAIDDEAHEVRIAAMASLGRLRDAEAFDALLAKVTDADATIAQVALLSAAEVGGERAAEAALKALTSERPELRFQAVATLPTVLGARARGHLVGALEDHDAEVRANAASALGELFASHDPGDGRKVAADALAARVRDPVWGVRAEAALALAKLDDARGAAELVRAFDDAERALPAIEALGELRAKGAREALARVARSFLKSLVMKAAASAALVKMDDPRGVEGLRAVLKAWRGDGRTYAVTVAGELRVEALAPELAALSVKPRGADPVAVAEALSQLESPVAREALKQMAQGSGEAADRAKELLAR